MGAFPIFIGIYAAVVAVATAVIAVSLVRSTRSAQQRHSSSHRYENNQTRPAERKYKHDTRTRDEAYIDKSEIEIDETSNGVLGRGGFGIVRTGVLLNIDQSVAVKIPWFEGSQRQILAAKEKFAKEIDLLQKINHENILRIYGYTTWKSSKAIVMEYMQNGNLNDLLFYERNGDRLFDPNLFPALCLRLSYDISSGVSYLHFAFSKERIVHGDLKPSNVLLTSDLRCKIADFGGADMAIHTELIDSRTNMRRRDIECTLGFVAPERLRNVDIRVSKAMDVFSVGMIFYVLMRCQKPCRDIDQNLARVQSYCRQFVIGDPLFHLAKLTLECTNRVPENRCGMQEVKNNLQNLLHQQDPVIIGEQVADVLSIYITRTSFDSSTLAHTIR